VSVVVNIVLTGHHIRRTHRVS